MVSWKGLALLAAFVAQVAAQYQPNSHYDIYAREAEAEAYDDELYGDIYARDAEPEADYDDDFDLNRRVIPGQGGSGQGGYKGYHPQGQGQPSQQYRRPSNPMRYAAD